jgi:hypothetical protein
MRRGSYLVGCVEDTPFIGFYDPQPLTGRHVGIVAQDNEQLNLKAASAWGANSYDTTFTGAPTEWYVQKGVWEVTERWKCDPRWTWFGGHSHPTPVLWSKHDYAGDLVLEFYAGIQMNQKEPPYYLRPSDLNATLCGNGTDLSSGYSFIFAGWDNAVSRIIKGHNQILAEANSLSAVFDRPSPDGDLNRFHRHWYRIRIEKHGGHLRYTVDDQLVAEATDPNPLESGKIALWTVNNGLMIARVRLWYERQAPTKPFPDLAAAHGAANRGEPNAPVSALHNDFEHSLGAWQALPGEWANRRMGEWANVADSQTRKLADSLRSPFLSLDDTTAAAGHRSLRVTNLTSGGEFAVRAVSEPFDAAQYPLLSFAYRLCGRVAVNVHIKVLDTWHTLGFTLAAEESTAPQAEAEASALQRRWLGQIPSVGFDNQWHPARFDLGAALRRFYPTGPLTVQEIVLANRSPDRYLFAGFGGNGFGTTYYLDDFRIGEKDEG